MTKCGSTSATEEAVLAPPERPRARGRLQHEPIGGSAAVVANQVVDGGDVKGDDGDGGEGLVVVVVVVTNAVVEV